MQSPQDDFGQDRDTATPAQAAEQSWQQPQQVQQYVPPQPAPNGRRPYATGLTSAQQVWYTLQCIYFGMGYFAKIPAKKALEDYGMAQLTSAEQFWYTVQCIFFGAGYFAKLPTAKALSEMPVFQTAGYR
jgi:hypothetical protein